MSMDLDALLEEMTGDDAGAGGEDEDYLKLLEDMVEDSDSPKTDVSDDALDNLLLSMERSSRASAKLSSAGVSSDYSDMLDDILASEEAELEKRKTARQSALVSDNRDSFRPSVERDYSSLMDELMGDVTDSALSSASPSRASIVSESEGRFSTQSIDEDYSDLMEELMDDMGDPSANPSTAPKAGRVSKTDNILDDLISEVQSDASMGRVTSVKLSFSEERKSGDLMMDELLGDLDMELNLNDAFEEPENGDRKNKTKSAIFQEDADALISDLLNPAEDDDEEEFKPDKDDYDDEMLSEFMDDMKATGAKATSPEPAKSPSPEPEPEPEPEQPKERVVSTTADDLMNQLLAMDDSDEETAFDAPEEKESLTVESPPPQQRDLNPEPTLTVEDNIPEDNLNDVLDDFETNYYQQAPAEAVERELEDSTVTQSKESRLMEKELDEFDTSGYKVDPRISGQMDQMLDDLKGSDTTVEIPKQENQSEMDELLDQMIVEQKQAVGQQTQKDPLAKSENPRKHRDSGNSDLLDEMLSQIDNPAAAPTGGPSDDMLDAMIDSFETADKQGVDPGKMVFSSPFLNEAAQKHEQDLQEKRAKARAELEKKRREKQEYETALKQEEEARLTKQRELQDQVRKKQEEQRRELDRVREEQEQERRKKEQEEQVRLMHHCKYSELAFDNSRKLGVGSFGMSYRGGNWKGKKDADCIIKRLRCNRMNEKWIKDFNEETDKLCKVEHPNLAKLFATCSEEEFVTVFEYVRGCNLSTVIKNSKMEKKIDALMLQIAREVAAGMSHLHDMGVVHRALTPNNIIVCGGQDGVKITDYGFVFIKDNIHVTGGLGQPEYHAPELFDSSGRGRQLEYNEKADVYSFGVILWEMFSRKSAFQGIQPIDIPVEVCAKGFRPEMPKNAPVSIQNLIKSCWDKDPSTRPTFQEITENLDQPLKELLVYKKKAAPKKPVEEEEEIDSNTGEIKRIGSTVTEKQMKTIYLILKKTRDLLCKPDQFNQLKGCKALLDIHKRSPKMMRVIVQSGIIGDLIGVLGARKELVKEFVLKCISLLAEASPMFSEDFCNRGGMTKVVEIFRIPKSSNLMKLSALKAITALAKNESACEAVRHAGGLKMLILLLDSEDHFIQLQVAHTFSRLLQLESNQDEFADKGGIRPLLKLMKVKNPGVQIRLLETVEFLAAHPKMIDEVDSSGIMKRYVDLLSSSNLLLQRLAIKAVAKFCSKPESRNLLDLDLAIRGLVGTIKPALTEDMLIHVLQALQYLLVNGKDCGVFVSHNGIASMIQKLTGANKNIQLHGMLLLSNILKYHPKAAIEVYKAGGVVLVCKLMLTAKVEKQSACLFIIAALSHEVNCIETIGKAGAIPQIIKLLEIDDDLKNSKALEALSFLSTKTQNCTIIDQSPSVYGSLKKFTSEDSPTSYQSYATRVISNLCLNSVYHRSIREAGLIDDLLRFLSSSTSTIQSLSLKCVLLLCREGENKGALRDADANKHLSSLLSSSAPNIQAAAKRALQFLG